MINAYIRGTGSYAPKNIVKNDFFERVGSSDQWIYENLGIKERRISTGETTSDLAYQAGLLAIQECEPSPQEIDLIILATATRRPACPFLRLFCSRKTESKKCSGF